MDTSYLITSSRNDIGSEFNGRIELECHAARNVRERKSQNINERSVCGPIVTKRRFADQLELL